MHNKAVTDRCDSHLMYAATLPCDLSLMASFADINVSQGTVATYAGCGGIFSIHLTTDLPRNLPANFLNRLRFEELCLLVCGPTFSVS